MEKFNLVRLFYGISTFISYLMPNPINEEFVGNIILK